METGKPGNEKNKDRVMPSRQGFWALLRDTFQGWSDDDPFRQSAAIAYYAIFSLPALLLIVISVAGFFFGSDVVGSRVSESIASVMGSETAKQVNEMIVKAGDIKKSVVASIIGIVTIVVGATGVFEQLQKSLNQIWDVEVKPKQAFLKMLKDRLFSFGIIVSIGFLLLVSLVVTALLTAFGGWLKTRMPDVAVYMLNLANFLVSFGITTVLFALMFKVLPDARISWRYVWVGALLTSVLFTIGKYALAMYFGKAAPESAYGAAGSIILILLWVSYSCMIVFFGAEFTKQFSMRYGHGIKPAGNAQVKKEDKVE